MTAHAEYTEARLIELEIRLGFQDESIEALQQQNLDQQHQLDELNTQLSQLKDRLRALAPSPLEAGHDPRLEPPPPHY
jgi:SlyX protein